jgi:hypothetical protein
VKAPSLRMEDEAQSAIRKNAAARSSAHGKLRQLPPFANQAYQRDQNMGMESPEATSNKVPASFKTALK